MLWYSYLFPCTFLLLSERRRSFIFWYVRTLLLGDENTKHNASGVLCGAFFFSRINEETSNVKVYRKYVTQMRNKCMISIFGNLSFCVNSMSFCSSAEHITNPDTPTPVHTRAFGGLSEFPISNWQILGGRGFTFWTQETERGPRIWNSNPHVFRCSLFRIPAQFEQKKIKCFLCNAKHLHN